MERFLDHVQHEVSDADVVILPLPYEGTVSYLKGTTDGPGAILEASLQLEEVEEELRWEPSNTLRLHTANPIAPDRGETPESYIAKVKEFIDKIPADKVIIGLGGEHTVTVPLALRVLAPGDTLIAIDAHPDLRESYEGSPYSHACVTRRLCEAGFSTIQLGVGCISAGELEYIESGAPVEHFPAIDLATAEGLESAIGRIKALKGGVYLTIDLDGLSTSYMPGVGTPVPGGIEWHALLKILRALLFNEEVNVKGMDIVELSPIQGQVLSEFSAAKILQKLLSYNWRSRR